MITNCAANESFEISPRFQRTVEERIARLERDAEHDEAQVAQLVDGDHIRRRMRLVAIQRSEALRMRLFLDRSKTRLPRPRRPGFREPPPDRLGGAGQDWFRHVAENDAQPAQQAFGGDGPAHHPRPDNSHALNCRRRGRQQGLPAVPMAPRQQRANVLTR